MPSTQETNMLRCNGPLTVNGENGVPLTGQKGQNGQNGKDGGQRKGFAMNEILPSVIASLLKSLSI